MASTGLSWDVDFGRGGIGSCPRGIPRARSSGSRAGAGSALRSASVTLSRPVPRRARSRALRPSRLTSAPTCDLACSIPDRLKSKRARGHDPLLGPTRHTHRKGPEQYRTGVGLKKRMYNATTILRTPQPHPQPFGGPCHRRSILGPSTSAQPRRSWDLMRTVNLRCGSNAADGEPRERADIGESHALRRTRQSWQEGSPRRARPGGKAPRHCPSVRRTN
jgi:hypothetical protein